MKNLRYVSSIPTEATIKRGRLTWGNLTAAKQEVKAWAKLRRRVALAERGKG